MLKSQILFMVGGGLIPIFQLLMLSPKMLKSQIPFKVGWGAGNQLPTFDA